MEGTGRFVCSHFQQIPFRENYFDGVIAYGSLLYATYLEIKCAVDEIYRVLKSGGKVFVVSRGNKDQRYACGDQIEKNTFIIRCDDESNPAYAENGMIMHFFDKSELIELFDKFSMVKIDEVCETHGNGKYPEFRYVV